MPMFEFRCRRCQFVFEKYFGGQETLPGTGETCPHCGGTETEKVFSVFSTQGGGDTVSTGGCGTSGLT